MNRPDRYYHSYLSLPYANEQLQQYILDFFNTLRRVENSRNNLNASVNPQIINQLNAVNTHTINELIYTVNTHKKNAIAMLKKNDPYMDPEFIDALDDVLYKAYELLNKL